MAMVYNIPAIIYGIAGFIVFLNLAAMSGAHAKYIYFEKTTNERVRSKAFPRALFRLSAAHCPVSDQKEVPQ